MEENRSIASRTAKTAAALGGISFGLLGAMLGRRTTEDAARKRSEEGGKR